MVRLRVFISIALVTLSSMCLLGPAWAARFAMSTGEPRIEQFPGDPWNLPIGCSVTEAELIAHARGMQKVQTAMAEFERRGYTLIPEGVCGRVGCARPTLYSTVAFVYRRPIGIPDPDSTYGLVPVIRVVTQLNETSEEPSTLVTGGLYAVSVERETIEMATDLVAPEERPFDIQTHEPALASGQSVHGSSMIGDYYVSPGVEYCVIMHAVCAGPAAYQMILGTLTGSPSSSREVLAKIVAGAGVTLTFGRAIITQAYGQCRMCLDWGH